jgi:hypothetical protein
MTSRFLLPTLPGCAKVLPVLGAACVDFGGAAGGRDSVEALCRAKAVAGWHVLPCQVNKQCERSLQAR